MVPFATLPLVAKFRFRSQRGPSPGLLSIWTQKSPPSRSSSSASSCAWSATSPPSRLVCFWACSVTNALRITSVLTPTGRRYTIALLHDHIAAEHAGVVYTLPEEPPRARGAGDLGPAKAESPALRGAREFITVYGLWDAVPPLKGGTTYGQCAIHLRLSRCKLVGPPTPRDTEAFNAYALMHDALGPICSCSLIGINSFDDSPDDLRQEIDL
jgi:hypothetical protein